MESAFWDHIRDAAAGGALRGGPAVALVVEFRDELAKLAPGDSWRRRIHEALDVDLLKQVLASGSCDFAFLQRLLGAAVDLLLQLGAPVRDQGAMSAHRGLLDELAADVAALGSGGEEDVAAPGASTAVKGVFAGALVKGLRFVFEQLQVLKQDLTAHKLSSLALYVNSPAGVSYIQSAFAKKHGICYPAADTWPRAGGERDLPAAELARKLPRTARWLADAARGADAARVATEDGLAGLGEQDGPSQDAPAGVPASMRTGGRGRGSGGDGGLLRTIAQGSACLLEERSPDWGSPAAAVRVGVVALLASERAATAGGEVPEALALDAMRLELAQSEFQALVVVATGLLQLRQFLAGSGLPGVAVAKALHNGGERLASLLRGPSPSYPKIGALLAEIIEGALGGTVTGGGPAAPPPAAPTAETMTRVMAGALAPGGIVYAKVAASLADALRALLLLGGRGPGAALARGALRRVGAADLAGSVAELASKADQVATVTLKVHGPLYAALLAAAPEPEPPSKQ